MEQKYIIKNVDSFEPKHIFECGQCFRWNLEKDGSYTGVVGNNVINVKKEYNDITIKGTFNDNIKDVCNRYFDLNTDYLKIKNELSKIDDNLKTSVNYGEGIRILNQDLWEMIISYKISANNNIPRIKGIIERLSQKYGKELSWNGNKYYTFPTIEELSKASVKELRELGLGFRDVRVFETTRIIANKIVDIEELEEMEDVEKLRIQLLRLPGVGPKVADCILLFSDLKRFDVFPIDVWVRRVMNELYINNPDESKVNKKDIARIAKEKFGDLEGLAQQYLFYWKREA